MQITQVTNEICGAKNGDKVLGNDKYYNSNQCLKTPNQAAQTEHGKHPMKGINDMVLLVMIGQTTVNYIFTFPLTKPMSQHVLELIHLNSSNTCLKAPCMKRTL
jgi:hypothetical protein